MKKIAVLSMVLLLMGFAVAANAAPSFTIYTSYLDFLEVCPNPVVENFEDTTLIPGLSINEVGTAGVIDTGIYSNKVDSSPVQTQEFVYSSMYSFGGFFDLTPVGTGTGIEIFADGNSVATITNTGDTQYFGFTSDTLFTNVLLSVPADGSGQETYFIVDLQLCPAPIPGSLLLLGSGILGIVGIGIRRKSA